MRMPSRSLVAATIAALLTGPAALAQRASENPGTLEEIIVTATKRAQNIQDVPLSIVTYSGDQLAQRGVGDVLSLDKAVPGLMIQNSGNDPYPIIRGAGVAGTTDIAVPFYVDGTYRPRSGQGLAGYLDLERVEVLKGPQGTLFGRNTLGGLINIVTKKPSFSGLAGGAAITGGAYSDRKLEGFVNVPMTDKLALRVTAAAEKRDPFVENTANKDGGLKDANYVYGRGQLLWKATDSLSFNLTGTYWHDTSNGNNDYSYKVLGIPVNATTHEVDGVTGFLDQRQGLRTGWGGGKAATGNISNGDTSAQIYSDPYKVAWDYKPSRDIKETSFTLNMTWQLPGHELVANATQFDYSELRLADGELSTMPSYVAGQITKSKAHQFDVNLNSTGTGKLKYTLGAYLYDDSKAGDNSSAFIFGYTYATPQNPSWATWLYQGNGGTKSTAVYGQADYALTDKLTATAGARWSRDERSSYYLNVDPTSLTNDHSLPSFGGAPTSVQSGSDTHNDWRLGVQYKLAKDVMVYTSVATGYIAGATQNLTNKLLDPQTVRMYEFGAKSTALDGHLRMNAAMYAAKYTGLTTTIFVPVGNTILAQQIPGGSTRSRGVEMDATYLPTAHMEINLGFAADRTVFDHFNAADRLGTNGSSYIDANGKGWFILDGQATAFSPDLTAFLGVSYEFGLTGHGTLTPAVFAKYSDQYKTTSEPYFWAVQPSYTMVDASLAWSSPDHKWSARLFVNNLTDKAVMTEGTVYSGARAIADFAAPRFWGLRIGYSL